MKTTEEKNRMIAEFMVDKLQHMFPRYDTSWDWLMPVVEKISKLGFEFQIDPNETYFKENDGDYEIVASAFNGSVLENTYEAVIQFIEWYNENK